MTDDWCPENDGAYRAEMAAIHKDKTEATLRALSAALARVEANRNAALEDAQEALESLAERADARLEAVARAALEAAAQCADYFAYTDYASMHYPEGEGMAASHTTYETATAIRAIDPARIVKEMKDE